MTAQLRPGRRVAAAISALLAVLVAAQLSPAHAAGKAFAWKATGRQGVVYLVGSVHLLSKDFYPLDPALDSAYKDSSLLVEEADLGQMMAPEVQMNILGRAMLPSSQPLDSVLSPRTRALLDQHLGDLGGLAGPLKMLKPWMIALTIEELAWQKAGFDQNLGLDMHFYKQAQSDGKAVQGLETVDFQISLLDGLPMAQQDRLLAETLKDIDDEQANVAKLVDAWRDGDAPTVERIVLADLKADPDLYQKILVDRTRSWLPKVEALFARPGHALVVVGAAHLVGPDGLLALLKANGYAIEQM